MSKKKHEGRHRDPLDRRRRRFDDPVPEIYGLNFKYIINRAATTLVPIYRKKKDES